MKELKIFSILIFLGVTSLSFGQDLEVLDKKLTDFGTQKNTKSWYENNFFLDLKLAAGTEHMAFRRTPITLVEGVDTFSWFARPYLFSLASFAVEPRVNLKTFSNNSVFFAKAPTGVSFSITTKSSYKIKAGFFHFQTGLLFGIGTGLHSKKSNVNSNGFAVSVGIQYLRAPIFGHEAKIEKKVYIAGYGVNRELIDNVNKNSILPTAQIDLYYLNMRNKPRGYSLTVGAFRSVYIKFAMTILDKAD